MINPRWKAKMTALALVGGVIFAGTKIGSCSGCGSKKEIETPIDNEIDNKKISTREQAQERGLLKSSREANSDSIEKAIRENSNLSTEVKNFFSIYNQALTKDQPAFDKSILERNIELLKVKACTKREMEEMNDDRIVYSSFCPYTHELCLLKEEDGHINYDKISETIYTTLGYVARQYAEEKEDGTIVDISFSYNDHGMAFETAINQYYTNNLQGCVDFTNVASYDNVQLLTKSVMPIDILFPIYTDGDIFELQEALEEINPNLNAEKFVECADKQYILKTDNDSSNDYDLDWALYSQYVDLYIAYYDQHIYQYENNYFGFKQSLENVNSDEKTRKKLVKYLEEENQKVRSK